MADLLGLLNLKETTEGYSASSLAEVGTSKKIFIDRSAKSANTSNYTTNTTSTQSTYSPYTYSNTSNVSTYSPSSVYAPQIAYNSAGQTGANISGAKTPTYIGGSPSTQNLNPSLEPSVGVTGGAQGATASTGSGGGSGGFDFDTLIIAGAVIAGIFVLTKL